MQNRIHLLFLLVATISSYGCFNPSRFCEKEEQRIRPLKFHFTVEQKVEKRSTLFIGTNEKGATEEFELYTDGTMSVLVKPGSELIKDSNELTMLIRNGLEEYLVELGCMETKIREQRRLESRTAFISRFRHYVIQEEVDSVATLIKVPLYVECYPDGETGRTYMPQAEFRREYHHIFTEAIKNQLDSTLTPGEVKGNEYYFEWSAGFVQRNTSLGKVYEHDYRFRFERHNGRWWLMSITCNG